jgi:hypothetical protein
VTGEEFVMLWMNEDMKEHTFHIQTEHKILGPDHGLEHVKILVGGLTLNRGFVGCRGFDTKARTFLNSTLTP